MTYYDVPAEKIYPPDILRLCFGIDAAEKKRKQERTVTGMDYIDRKALRDALYDADAITMNGVKITNQFPSADVAPVRHGRWTIAEDDYYGLNIVKCSVCHEEWCFEERDDVFDLNYHYCPNCGSLMDKEEPNEL